MNNKYLLDDDGEEELTIKERIRILRFYEDSFSNEFIGGIRE